MLEDKGYKLAVGVWEGLVARNMMAMQSEDVVQQSAPQSDPVWFQLGGPRWRSAN